MYRISRTLFHYKNGNKRSSDKVVDVVDLEEYRESIMRPQYERINFVYQEISENEYNRESSSD